MDIQFNNASMVGTRSDRLNHIVIECPETTRKISEQAKKFFPRFFHRIHRAKGIV